MQSISREGTLNYHQNYLEYDSSSNPTRIQMPAQAGALCVDYDLLNRKVKIHTKQWEERQRYENDLLNQRVLRDQIGKNVSEYSYDAREQLISES